MHDARIARYDAISSESNFVSNDRIVFSFCKKKKNSFFATFKKYELKKYIKDFSIHRLINKS